MHPEGQTDKLLSVSIGVHRWFLARSSLSHYRQVKSAIIKKRAGADEFRAISITSTCVSLPLVSILIRCPLLPTSGSTASAVSASSARSLFRRRHRPGCP